MQDRTVCLSVRGIMQQNVHERTQAYTNVKTRV